MLKQFTPEGILKYPNFLETVAAIKPMYMLRVVGGLFYLTGTTVGIYNLIKTAGQGVFQPDEDAEAPALEKKFTPHSSEGWHRVIERRPVQMLLFSLILVAIGGIIEFVPTFLIESNVPSITSVNYTRRSNCMVVISISEKDAITATHR
jgi:cytochrome c oxidase cbb3-type subunit I/II